MPPPRQKLPESADAASRLSEVARGMLEDLRVGDVDRLRIAPHSRLDQDLGLDSLARVEFFARVEQEFKVHLPDTVLQAAETLGDVLAALNSAAPAAIRRAAPRPTAKPAMPAAAPVAPPPAVTTLDQVLAWHVEQHPDKVQITLCDGEADVQIGYAQLLQQSREIAGGLQHHGIRMGDTVALMLPTGADYFHAFFGVLLAGAVPVPLYPPARLSQIEEHVRRHAGILHNCGAKVLITVAEMRGLATVLRMHAPALRKIVTNDDLRRQRAAPLPVAVNADAVAMLQYTSGSTGQPKGVMLSHANILANISTFGAALRIDSDDVFVSWLPLYHDMGLIGAWLGTLYFGLPLYIMSPLTFLGRPVRWLEAIHRYRGTMSAAPNFAYELCLKRVTDDELAGLDLGSWRVAMNGAEAVMPDTLLRFQERFARCGFKRTTMLPVYGLAECSVGLSAPPLDRGPLIDAIEREPFVQEGHAVAANDAGDHPLRFVSCGLPIPGHRVRVMDDAGRELPERREGRLEFSGPSATRGYFRNPQATAGLMHEGWLDSGDRAYIAGGEIYLTGRIKDIIIRAGRHIYPEELEAAIGTIAGVRKGCVAVFGSLDEISGTERMVVMAETHEATPEDREALRQKIVQETTTLIGEPPDDVVLAAPHTVLKTSSGKIRRAACRELYESGGHRASQVAPAWQQVLRLSARAIGPLVRRALRRSAELAYAAYFWIVFASLAALLCPLILVPLRSARIWAITRRAARTFIWLSRMPVTVSGQVHLDGTRPLVVVANHASYLDGLFLVATLPRHGRFVAKRELARVPLIGTFLRRLDTQFVERFDTRASVAGAQDLAAVARAGHSCIFFPEGTFTRAPGLMPFHLGAFTAAVQAEVPVLPVAICGTRSLLRDEQWLPRRTPIAVNIGQPIPPPHAASEFLAAVQLRDAARDWIRQRCGEPDLVRHA